MAYCVDSAANGEARLQAPYPLLKEARTSPPFGPISSYRCLLDFVSFNVALDLVLRAMFRFFLGRESFELFLSKRNRGFG